MREFKSILRFILGAVMLSVATLTLAAGHAVKAKIGLFTPLTGASAIVGLDMQRGAQLAIERVNAGYKVPLKDGKSRSIGPGLMGSPVELIIEDDESRAAAAMDAVRKLVSVNNVAVVIGEYSSGRTMPTGQWTNENKVVHISIGANSPKLRDIGPYFFSTIGLASLQGPQLVKLAKSEVGAKKIATFFPNNPYGVGVEIATCEAAPQMGLECVAKVRYEEQKTDYRPELRQLTAPDPDAVIFFAYGAEAALVLRQAYEMGLKAAEKWIGTEVSNWGHEVTETPVIAEGIRGIEHSVGGDFYDKGYAQAYQKRFGEPPLTVFGAYGYDSAMLAALAIQKAGSTDSDAIRKALFEVSKTFHGFTGDTSVDKDGMQVSEAYGTFIFKDGALRPYSPKM
ncbi:MAG: ABC transporter substrate-binding protein [Chromatiales bacterium]|nr:ABC transporter substrate-binding protein [Chromatiales bacterium]